jgi:carbonic anhydrase
MSDHPNADSSDNPFRDVARGVARFKGEIFPRHRSLYRQLVRNGQKPRALMISCADSRVIPELITQSQPGELFVCRNAGNIVPPYAQMNGGVSSAIEYAVMALGVRDIVVCGHSDCGAMAALLKPDLLATMPNVAAWLRHSQAAERIVNAGLPPTAPAGERQRLLALENVIAQVNHLRTHPSVAAAMAGGSLALHGWFFELEHGSVLAFDGSTGRFTQIAADVPPPVAVPPRSADQRAMAPLSAE